MDGSNNAGEGGTEAADPIIASNATSSKGIAATASKTAIRKLENTVAFLKAELASEVRFKEEVIAQLARTDAAYQSVQVEMRGVIERLSAQHAQDMADTRAAHAIALESQANEVRTAS